MLNDYERRTLSGIEAGIQAADPSLAAALSGKGHRRTPPRVRGAYTVVGVIAAVLAVLCLALSGVGAGPAGLLAAGFAALTFVLRHRRFPHARSSGPDRRRRRRR